MIPVLALFLQLSITGEVRKAINAGDLAAADRLAQEHRKQNGISAQWLEAYSWVARGALAAKKYDEAERVAAAVEKEALAMLKTRKVDDDKHLPIAIGAAIEVQGQALVARGQRSEAVSYLQDQRKLYAKTSMLARIQKNINLLTLEGKPAPALEGVKLKGPTVLFLWAHWCGDCKAMAPVLAEVQAKYPGVTVVGPTQLYGYVAGGKDAPPGEERPYIARVREQFYGQVKMASPISQENFKVYGVSTTPTFVLVDAKGIVRLYHPGRLTAAELGAHIEKLPK